MFYSKSTGGFYDVAIHENLFVEQVDTDHDGITTARFLVPDPDGPIPDAVEITGDQHAALLAGQSAGKFISADANGYPVLTDPPPPTQTQIIATLRAQARTALAASDITVLRCLAVAVPVPDAWTAYRTDLRICLAAETACDLPSRPTYPAGT